MPLALAQAESEEGSESWRGVCGTFHAPGLMAKSAFRDEDVSQLVQSRAQGHKSKV